MIKFIFNGIEISGNSEGEIRESIETAKSFLPEMAELRALFGAASSNGARIAIGEKAPRGEKSAVRVPVDGSALKLTATLRAALSLPEDEKEAREIVIAKASAGLIEKDNWGRICVRNHDSQVSQVIGKAGANARGEAGEAMGESFDASALDLSFVPLGD